MREGYGAESPRVCLDQADRPTFLTAARRTPRSRPRRASSRSISRGRGSCAEADRPGGSVADAFPAEARSAAALQVVGADLIEQAALRARGHPVRPRARRSNAAWRRADALRAGGARGHARRRTALVVRADLTAAAVCSGAAWRAIPAGSARPVRAADLRCLAGRRARRLGLRRRVETWIGDRRVGHGQCVRVPSARLAIRGVSRRGRLERKIIRSAEGSARDERDRGQGTGERDQPEAHPGIVAQSRLLTETRHAWLDPRVA